jgi:hypothetical protein
MISDDRWEQQLRAGQDEVVHYIQKRPNAAKEIAGFRWLAGPGRDERVLELSRGDTFHMIHFTLDEFAELGSRAGRRALDKVGRFFGRGE